MARYNLLVKKINGIEKTQFRTNDGYFAEMCKRSKKCEFIKENRLGWTFIINESLDKLPSKILELYIYLKN